MGDSDDKVIQRLKVIGMKPRTLSEYEMLLEGGREKVTKEIIEGENIVYLMGTIDVLNFAAKNIKLFVTFIKNSEQLKQFVDSVLVVTNKRFFIYTSVLKYEEKYLIEYPLEDLKAFKTSAYGKGHNYLHIWDKNDKKYMFFGESTEYAELVGWLQTVFPNNNLEISFNDKELEANFDKGVNEVSYISWFIAIVILAWFIQRMFFV